MAFPNPSPVDAANCVIYGFIRDSEGGAVEGAAVLVGPPEGRADVGAYTTGASATDAGEAFVEDWREALTDSDGYFQIELRQGATVRMVITAVKLDVEGQVPAEANSDFIFWAYTPAIADSRQFTADPVNAPTDVDTALVVQVPTIFRPITVKLFDQIMIYEAATRNGIYLEKSVALTRLVLEDDKEFYEFRMDAQDPGNWYKARFLDSTSGRMGPLSLPLRAVAPDYAIVTTVAELKSFYLFGVDLTDDDGNIYPKGMFERYIRDAISWFERELNLSLKPTAREERQDFRVQDFVEWEFLQLDKIPVLVLDRVDHMLGKQQLFNIPSDWYNLDQESGHVRIVPQQGTLSEIMIGSSGRYLGPAIQMNSTFPGFIRAVYRYGFDLDMIPEEFKHVISMRAAMGPLNIAGDLLGGAGVASWSLGMDGVHQSVSTTSSATNAGYGARVIQYTKEIKERMAGLKRHYNGLRFTVV